MLFQAMRQADCFNMWVGGIRGDAGWVTYTRKERLISDDIEVAEVHSGILVAAW